MVSSTTDQLYYGMRKQLKSTFQYETWSVPTIVITVGGKLQPAYGLGSAYPCSKEAPNLTEA